MTRDARPGASPARVGYLGPVGTFTEQALFTQDDLVVGEIVAIRSIPEVLAATATGEVDVGFVAIENSIEGTVNVTLDTLAFDLDLLIQREVVINVQHNLLAPAGVALEDIKRVMSIPVATAQCRKFLEEKLPGAEAVAANSTAEAARAVAAAADGHTAAIGPARSAVVHGLDTLIADIEDHPDNQTRFVAVTRRGIPAPTGHDKTSIVVFQRADVPGSLLSILQEFAARQINLTKLESRPTKKILGDYCFIIDLEGHVADEVVADSLREIHMKQASVKFLGSYPAAGDDGHAVRQEAADAWLEANDWIEGLRRQIGM